MTDRFAGAWRVREHVFGSDARYLGAIAQRRHLVEDGAARRVIQDNHPEPALADHPIAAFAGHHEFALVRDGRHRRYQGPAVIGSGLEIDDGVMVSAGLWPALGWSFSAWSILTAPGRQLTGGGFRRGSAAIATIVGVAAPETTSSTLDLAGPVHPAEVAESWTGTWRRVDLDGIAIATTATTRRYQGAGWSDSTEVIELTGTAAAIAATGHCEALVRDTERGGATARPGTARVTAVGAGRRLGPVLELELWGGRGRRTESGALAIGPTLAITALDVLDVATTTLVGLRWRHRDGRLESIDVIRLRPGGAS